jgi:hypothetical protein
MQLNWWGGRCRGWNPVSWWQSLSGELSWDQKTLLLISPIIPRGKGDYARHFAALIGKLSILESADVTHSIINGDFQNNSKLLKVWPSGRRLNFNASSKVNNFKFAAVYSAYFLLVIFRWLLMTLFPLQRLNIIWWRPWVPNRAHLGCDEIDTWLEVCFC